jgi:hypothetical protein
LDDGSNATELSSLSLRCGYSQRATEAASKELGTLSPVGEWIIGDHRLIEAISLAGFTLRTRAKATTAIKLMLHSPRSTIPT